MIGRLWNRYLAAHRSREYDVQCALEATTYYEDLRVRLTGGEHLTLEQEHELNRLIVAWSRAHMFNLMMNNWHPWNGPYPLDMEWVGKFSDDIDASQF